MLTEDGAVWCWGYNFCILNMLGVPRWISVTVLLVLLVLTSRSLLNLYYVLASASLTTVWMVNLVLMERNHMTMNMQLEKILWCPAYRTSFLNCIPLILLQRVCLKQKAKHHLSYNRIVLIFIISQGRVTSSLMLLHLFNFLRYVLSKLEE